MLTCGWPAKRSRKTGISRSSSSTAITRTSLLRDQFGQHARPRPDLEHDVSGGQISGGHDPGAVRRIYEEILSQAFLGMDAEGGEPLDHSSSSFKIVMNASCGISTEPIIFMRFLPAFCFSNSLRLRVMSPP